MPSTVSSGARQRSTEGTTSAISSSGTAPAASSRTSSATSSSEPRAPAPSKKRIAPSSSGPFGGESAKRCRSRWARAACPYSAERAGRSSIDAGERREILLRAAKRGERRPRRLVGQRDRHRRAPGERLEQPPLDARQVLEPVSEDGPAVPRAKFGTEPLDSAATEQVAVPETEPVELGTIGRVEQREISLELLRVQQPRLELGEHGQQRVREARESCRAPEPVQRRRRERAACDERPLGVGRNRLRVGSGECELAEDVVERPN